MELCFQGATSLVLLQYHMGESQADVLVDTLSKFFAEAGFNICAPFLVVFAVGL